MGSWPAVAGKIGNILPLKLFYSGCSWGGLLGKRKLMAQDDLIGPGWHVTENLKGSVDRGACCQAWWPWVWSWDSHGGQRELTPTSYPLISTYARWHIHTRNVNKQTKKTTAHKSTITFNRLAYYMELNMQVSIKSQCLPVPYPCWKLLLPFVLSCSLKGWSHYVDVFGQVCRWLVLNDFHLPFWKVFCWRWLVSSFSHFVYSSPFWY